MKRKTEASQQVTRARVGGQLVNQFFQRHSAILSDGGMPVVLARPAGDETIEFVMPPDFGYGSAVSVGDGYFLTAAHVPSKGEGGLFCLEKDGRPVAKSYRVVWREEDADIALLHADVDVAGVKWASDGELVVGTGIFTFGFGGGEWKPGQGQILGREFTGGANREVDLKLSAPVVAGDSGGPVVTAGGKLIGIVTRADYRWIRAFGRAWMRSGSHATRPDIGFLEAIIAGDRESRKTQPVGQAERLE